MLTDRHTRLLNRLAEEAILVKPVAQARIASFVVYQNEIISLGTNRFKSDPFQAKFAKNQDSIYLHAEIDALKGAMKVLTLRELERSYLYVCRVKYTDHFKTTFKFGNVSPCQGCQKAIRKYSIRQVIFTTDRNDYALLF